MIALQIISKVLQSQDNSIIEDNLLSVDYFVGYEEEYEFIQSHIKQYGNVPDKVTFLAKFPEFELVDCTESDNYLIDTAREEYLYYKSVPVIQKAAELLKTDSNAASEYLITAMKELQPNYDLSGVDIISDANTRYEQFVERQAHQESWFFTCGFPELDDLIHGIQRQDELFVIFARTNQGKSWVLEKMCTHIWELGFNVGYISPEMSAESIGYRFDTLHNHFSNKGLMWGSTEDVDIDNYNGYVDSLALSHNNKFIVSTPTDFDRKITVTKIRNWVSKYKLDCVAIDGITYMSDERSRRGDNKTVTLTNISEDLMALSMELKVPVLVVVQANRSGVVEQGKNDTPELESIRDSDGISHNASKVISIHQKEQGVLAMTVKKQRMGSVGGTLLYDWDIDKGVFNFIPTYEDAEEHSVTEEKVERVKKQFNDKEDLF